MMPKAETAGAQSFHRAMNILRMVAAKGGEGMRFTDLIHRSGLTPATTHRILQALVREGLVSQDKQTGLYQLGSEIYLLGLAASSRFSIQNYVTASLDRLVSRSGDTALFMIRRGDHGVFIGREEGTYPVRTHIAGVGDRMPLGIGSSSIAILAALADDEIEAILENNSEELRLDHSDMPGTDAIRSLVTETRQQGYAINPGWRFPESWAIALPVADKSGRCIGAMTIAGISSRIDPRRDEIVSILSAEIENFVQKLPDSISL